MLFREIPGLSELKTTLLQSIQAGQVAHAQLFLGNEGSASLPLALAFAQYLNCENRQPDDSCGVCAACSKTQKLIHPDLHFVFPVTTTKAVPKDPLSEHFLADWRRFVLQNPYQNLSDWLSLIGSENKQPNISAEQAREIIKTLSLKTYEAPFKIMLLWQPECLNQNAANALLKILEEPPPQTIFLLVGSKADNLLTTILSRTQLVKIRNFTNDEIAGLLTEKFAIEPSKALAVSALAEGNLLSALHLNTGLPDENLGIFRQWMRDSYAQRIQELLDFAEKFQKGSREEQRGLLEYGLGVWRDCLFWQAGAQEQLHLQPERSTFVNDFSKLLDEAKISFLYHQFNQALFHLERNANPRILCFDLSLHAGIVLKS